MTEPTAPVEANPPASTQPAASESHAHSYSYSHPRITIQYCTQCKWMLRAAYFAQELLSTFNTDIGEIALVPRTGGVFTVTIFPTTSTAAEGGDGTILWDRKTDGGFPEVKELKSRVRNVIDPTRNLGHTDRALKKGAETAEAATATTSTPTSTPAVSGKGAECEDCK
ncbi:SelT/SelW/SelH family protein [Aspergillus puulaauensis]|uniref:Rdx family-domain-containing protein n=1 Tax=Aspergillus puulaauensis TaxID=1220207 RepID=A0A7R7XXD9_9EURO|nr:uncharacterized protein APUU_71046S [Aspergillus puulaauensis]BCS29476.1 hypothetical protein APUU_71046S [Aspergillus puulaauensis]